MKKGLFVLLPGMLIAAITIASCAAGGNAGSVAGAAGNSTNFTDVPADAWYAEAVAYCREHGLLNGVSDTSFDPDGTLTRSMVATILYRADGEPAVNGTPAFPDTQAGTWYSDAIVWANAQGIVQGYDNGLFGGNDPVTKEQLDVILRRYQGEAPAWTGDPARAAAATRAEAAVAFYNTLTAMENTTSNESGKVLVAYFSRYGNTHFDDDVDAATSASIVVENGERQGTTERIARMIAEKTGADLHLIETEEDYPVNFDDVVDQNHQESAAGTRPALSTTVNFSSYDVIFVGYPVWASNAPTPVLSFLESGDLSGKRVIPFCTHDGYGAGSSYSAVSRSSAGATVETGLALAAPASDAQAAVDRWLEGLGFPEQAPEPSQGETALRITIGDVELEGVLYDSDMARQLMDQLPQTVSMSNYGGREVYGGIDRRIETDGEGQLRFDDGDITYCPANNTLAIFYAQSSRPNLTMEVYPIGKVTSDLSLFPDLPGRVDITFEVKDGRRNMDDEKTAPILSRPGYGLFAGRLRQ